MADATVAGRAPTPAASSGSSRSSRRRAPKRPQFKDEQVTMAHGAGGKATQTLIEGLLVPAFGSDGARRARATRAR